MVLYSSILAIVRFSEKCGPSRVTGLDMARRARLGQVNCRYATAALAIISNSPQLPPAAAICARRQIVPTLRPMNLARAGIDAPIVLARFRLCQIQ